MQANLNDLALQNNMDIVIVETAYPRTFIDGESERNIGGTFPVLLPGYPPSTECQLAFIRELLTFLGLLPNQRGKDIVYWESAWIPGVGWEPGSAIPGVI